MENKTIIFKLKTMRAAYTFQGHKDMITSNKFSFTKKSLITGSLDRTLKIWDLEKTICSKTVYFHPITTDIECMHVSML